MLRLLSAVIAPVVWCGGRGIYIRAKDCALDNSATCGGNDPREGDGFR
ncbi:MAG TPA: hypothetical protein VMA30_05995 [Xanthobacteraceae bacterium]|nr:hypothetical protein [Xanthobacteraceae bacterium]